MLKLAAKENKEKTGGASATVGTEGEKSGVRRRYAWNFGSLEGGGWRVEWVFGMELADECCSCLVSCFPLE